MESAALSHLSALSPCRSRRQSSFDPKGGNSDFWVMEPGETRVIFSAKGGGVIRHIWMTLECLGDPDYRRGLVLRATWDGQDRPSIDCPIGDFFGQGWGLTYSYQCGPFAAAPDQGKSWSCWLPMPFSEGARIELVNQTGVKIDRIYFVIDYDDAHGPMDQHGRLWAQYRQEQTQAETRDGRENEWMALGPYEDHPSEEGNYLWCEAEGHGHFVGVHYYVNCPTPMWYGEGDDMFLIDGERWPGLHGTGTEDYFNTAWSPYETFCHPSFGIALCPGSHPKAGQGPFGWIGRTHLYRFHLSDPIRFQTSLRASIEHGHANCLAMDLASVAFWYQSGVGKPLEPLPPFEERRPKPTVGVMDVHRWRDAWLQSQKGPSTGSA
jgi:hypothetical protein